ELIRYLEEAFSPSPYPQENSSRWADSIAFSIDDADTREIDDAITVSADGNCLEVGIHIADLSHFVKPNDPVDQVALRRCATMYLPTGPIFMIPPQISCEIASLNPEEPRPVLSLLVRFEGNGRILNWEFTRGTLRTQRRLNYEEVDAIITDPQSNPWGPQIKRLHKICQALQRNRLRNGAMIFDKQEMKLRIDDDVITPKVFPTISPARNLVAELMSLYNHLAAEFARRNRIPVIYRAQDKPDEPASRFVGKIIRETYPSAFRGLKKGRLTLKPQPHSGLGLRSYTQVSSPLRRFADLVMQRQLIAYLENMKYPYEPSNLLEVLNNAEIIEREHREIERRCTRYWELEFIRRQGIDREYEAVVMNKLPASYIVALQPWPVRGLLKSQELYKFGATVKVRIAALNPNLEVLRLVPVKESAGDEREGGR
ncbi:MAG: RNB domain-containing ribonuclease, partial [Lentisphaerae bacterium]